MVRLKVTGRRFHADILFEEGDVIECSAERAARLLRSFEKNLALENSEREESPAPSAAGPVWVDLPAPPVRRRRGRPRKNPIP